MIKITSARTSTNKSQTSIAKENKDRQDKILNIQCATQSQKAVFLTRKEGNPAKEDTNCSQLLFVQKEHFHRNAPKSN